MPTPYIQLALGAGAGLLAGAINTIAGGGGFIVFSTLVATGLAPATVNGTMRCGLLLQNATACLTFYRRGFHDRQTTVKLLPAICLGALVGALLATRLPTGLFRMIAGCAFILWGPVLIAKPGSFSKPATTASPPTRWWVSALTFLTGVYGGFLQAGVGFPLMALLISALGVEPVRANAIKVALVLGYTVVVLPLFIQAEQIAWVAGAGLALGMTVGAWIGVHLQIKRGAGFIRWVLVVMVIVAGLTMVL
ncbi:MAG: sulfite exporter TauE/SafE family protein [Deltaproteobacteria bacterium]|nr:sulfite exporter TauE/SafE family protein [Deltaproteobacteria bacterium]